LERLIPRLGGLDDDAELPFDLVLIDVLVVGEPLRPQRCLERTLLTRLHDRRRVARCALGLLQRGHESTISPMRPAASSIGTISESDALRSFSSATFSLRFRLLTVTRSVMPRRSASATFTPALSSRSSYRTSMPRRSSSATRA